MESVILEGPAISMWVLLSRRHQVQLQLKGVKTPGIIAALKRDIPGCENVRRVIDAVVPIEYAISQAGGEVDYNLVNIHAMRKTHPSSTVFVDAGVYGSPDDITDPSFPDAYASGLVELVLTLDHVRNPNGETYIFA